MKQSHFATSLLSINKYIYTPVHIQSFSKTLQFESIHKIYIYIYIYISFCFLSKKVMNHACVFHIHMKPLETEISIQSWEYQKLFISLFFNCWFYSALSLVSHDCFIIAIKVKWNWKSRSDGMNSISPSG